MIKNFKKIQGFILVGLFCVLLMALSAGFYWQMALKNNLSSTEKISLKIYPQDDFESVYAQLENYLLRPRQFVRVAHWMKYDQHIKSGYYVIKPQQGNKAIVRQLAQGLQQPVKLRFNNIRTLPQLAGVLSKQIMMDSTQIMDAMCDTAFLRAQGWTYETLPALFLPNTYEVWWNMSPERFRQVFTKAYAAFWNEDRLKKAADKGLTPVEVAIIASIIEEETNAKDEWPIVAGIYMNRLRRGMYLQACPTVKFALNDFSIKRVLKEHTEVDSPYNTYKHLGLPPGPVRIPSIAALEAVLKAEKHNYLYMCAKDDFSGRHYFSTNLRQHNEYARRYHQALNRKRIYK